MLAFIYFHNYGLFLLTFLAVVSVLSMHITFINMDWRHCLLVQIICANCAKLFSLPISPFHLTVWAGNFTLALASHQQTHYLLFHLVSTLDPLAFCLPTAHTFLHLIDLGSHLLSFHYLMVMVTLNTFQSVSELSQVLPDSPNIGT